MDRRVVLCARLFASEVNMTIAVATDLREEKKEGKGKKTGSRIEMWIIGRACQGSGSEPTKWWMYERSRGGIY